MRRIAGFAVIGFAVAATAQVVKSRSRGPGSRRRVRPAYFMVSLVSRIAPGMKPRVQKALINTGYQIVYRHGRKTDNEFMNFGYESEDSAVLDLGVPEAARYGAQLYDAVARAVDLAGKDVLEVGCGRGGGCAFVYRRFAPRSVTGLDLSSEAIKLARSRNRCPDLHFVCGDAEDLPFPSSSFDALLSVESSHNYPHIDRFFREAHRVLRPGGYLLFADLRRSSDMDDLLNEIRPAGFITVDEEIISPQVARALELDSARRTRDIERSVPRALQRPALEFAGVEGSGVHVGLKDGSITYIRMVLQKPGEQELATSVNHASAGKAAS